MNEFDMLIISGIVVVGILCQIIAWRTQMPAILYLLLTGFLVGPVLGLVNPDKIFGDLLFPVVSLGVAIILFEGALTLRFDEIRKKARVVWLLVTVGALITMGFASYAAHYIAGIPFNIALLFGAIVTVTGPTVIMPLLRTVRPSYNVANILRWEGIVIDPLGALFAVLVFELITLDNTGDVGFVFAKFMATGIFFGFFSGWFLYIIIRDHWIPDYLLKVFILAFVVGIYALSDAMQPESGLLTVTLMGIFLANKEELHLEEILDFKESLSVLIISSLFIVLAARMDISVFSQLGWTSLFVLAVIMFVARPVSIMLCTLGTALKWQERAILSWIAPRGIIAAAIAPLFALKLESYGIEGAELLPPLIFMVIVGTVIVQSLTAGPLAQILGAAEPENKGVLIFGANDLSRTIGKVLEASGFPVMIAGLNWRDLQKARMDGIRTFYGNVVSAHADRHLDLVGIGKLLAITQRPSLNALACMRYRREFGTNNVFSIKTEEEHYTRDQDQIASGYSAPFLSTDGKTQTQLYALLAQGHEIRATNITKAYTYEDFKEQYKDNHALLFAINKKGALKPFIENTNLSPEPGWKIISILAPQETQPPKTKKRKVASK